MTCAPKKRYAADKKPKFDIVKSNNELNIPAKEIDTDRSLLSSSPPMKMKQPAHMRTDDFTGNPESSAIESHLIVSDYTEPSCRTGKGTKRNLFVSAKYKRRTSSNSVTFSLPESDKIIGKDLNLAAVNKKGTEGFITSDEENNETDFDSWARRRMSAPELPPIATNGKNSALINNGHLTSRSNTFHNYRFDSEVKKNRKSIHSDSSLQGYRFNSHSRTSSSSSQKSRGRVLSAGTDRLTNGHVVPELQNLTEIPPSGSRKVEKPTKRSGMPTMVVPQRCTSVKVMRRTNSKLSLVNQSQKMSTPRGASLKHANSEGHLNRGVVETGQTQKQTDPKKTMRRISSDKSLSEQKNAKNSLTNGYTRNPPGPKNTPRSVNGVKKVMTSSRLSSKADEKKSDSGSLERLEDDSDSDCERDRRVKDWILGVTDAEPPEEPEIDYVDEPPQRDTAIRIVYEGDS